MAYLISYDVDFDEPDIFFFNSTTYYKKKNIMYINPLWDIRYTTSPLTNIFC